MAPIRRYLRISKYSVLECRIYLDNPALAQSWLLHPRKDILSRVIQSVRPYVLPKLREERERSRKKSAKKKGIKDVVVEDDFEVSIFLTETSTRHSLVTKHKHFHDTTQTKLKSTSHGRLIAEASDAPIDLDDVDAAAEPIIRPEGSDDEDAAVVLADIPAINATSAAHMPARPPKRGRRSTTDSIANNVDVDPAGRIAADQNSEDEFEVIISDDDNGAMDVNDDDDGLFVQQPPPAKRQKSAAALDGNEDDKKKLAMDISYEGFSIYGRVLCLVVKRRDIIEPGPKSGSANTTAVAGGRGAKSGPGQEMMESFIISTQIPAGSDVP
ncbi:hypothetical protein F5Y16DRAFT_403085 [Xylariaceae sp. FL0255]|nr:hypothetical protein F5Y16DRAFT_403085 [Xylariaceae sp. FL0255]